MLFRPSTADITIRYTTSSITFKHVAEKLEVGKTRQEIWVGSMAHALKSPSYEGYTAGRSLPLLYSNKARKILNNFRKRKQAKETLAKLELSLINHIYTKQI